MKQRVEINLVLLLRRLFIVILLTLFTGCNVIKSDLFLPQLMVLRKALASVVNTANTNNPVTPTCSETAKITITAPRFISLNQMAELKAVSDKAGYSFTWSQISGDVVVISNTNSDIASFIATEVPQESPKFQVTAKKDSCSFSSAVIVTPLESTANPVYVDVSYTGGSSDGSLEKPYTDVATAYSLAPGAIYVAEGNYPLLTQLDLIATKSIYGGFNSKFERKVSAYTTTLSDTRNGVAFGFTINMTGTSNSLRFDGMTVLGITSGNGASALNCLGGNARLSNLIVRNRGVSSPNDSAVMNIQTSCSVTLENSKLYANQSTVVCYVLSYSSNTAIIRNNELYGNSGCGGTYVIYMGGTNIQFTDYNYLDAVGEGNSYYCIGIYVTGVNSTIANQNISGGQNSTSNSFGILVDNSGNVATIKNNTIWGGVGTASSSGIFVTNTSGQVRIDGNTIYTNYRMGTVIAGATGSGIFLQSNLSHTIINNIILNNASTLDNYGIILDPSVGSNSIIANNTIKVSNSGSSWSRAIQIRGNSNPVITNNILFSESPTLGVGISEWNIGSDPDRFENNLIFNTPDGLYWDEGATYYSSIAAINIFGDIPIVGSNITTSPQTNYPLASIFIDPTNGDYRLKSGSPYLTSGKNVYNDPIYGSITTNRNGDPRPSSGSWSVGAY